MADEVRMIDGNALKEDFMNDYHNYMMESLRGNYHDTIRISEVIERIEDAPTIEAEPVKHGYWKTRLSTPDSMKCSVCGNSSIIWERYCPHCGARMDGDSE